MSVPSSIAPHRPSFIPASIPVVTQQLGDETAIVLESLGLVLVASKTTPGSWATVTDGACTCKGFRFRGTCRHLAVAEHALRNEGTARGDVPVGFVCAQCHTARPLFQDSGVCARCLADPAAD